MFSVAKKAVSGAAIDCKKESAGAVASSLCEVISLVRLFTGLSVAGKLGRTRLAALRRDRSVGGFIFALAFLEGDFFDGLQ